MTSQNPVPANSIEKCTIMQKDVLIEMVANALATVELTMDDTEIALSNLDPSLDPNLDQNYLADLRRYLYSTSATQLDFQQLASKVKQIRDKYLRFSNHSIDNQTDSELLAEIANYDVDADVESKFAKIWARLSADSKLEVQKNPMAFLIGGQPGAGKAFAIERIQQQLANNLLVINGDEFRYYHQYFQHFCRLYGDDSSKYMGAFAGKMVEKIRDQAIQQGFNILIEGTFRTIETPLNELKRFKQHGYQRQVVICTCPQQLSWQSTIERGNGLANVGLPPRYVPKDHHDLVAEKLAQNAQGILNSGLVDELTLYSRTAKLFDSLTDPAEKLEQIINDELNGKNLSH